jgi:hypothetical protein
VKVGDLVTLSAYGKKLYKFDWIVEGDVGLITKRVGPNHITYYRVLWNQSNKGAVGAWNRYEMYDRRELKFAKNMRQ